MNKELLLKLFDEMGQHGDSFNYELEHNGEDEGYFLGLTEGLALALEFMGVDIGSMDDYSLFRYLSINNMEEVQEWGFIIELYDKTASSVFNEYDTDMIDTSGRPEYSLKRGAGYDIDKNLFYTYLMV